MLAVPSKIHLTKETNVSRSDDARRIKILVTYVTYVIIIPAVAVPEGIPSFLWSCVSYKTRWNEICARTSTQPSPRRYCTSATDDRSVI